MIRLRNAFAGLAFLALPVSAIAAETKTLRPNNGEVRWQFTKSDDSGQSGEVSYQLVGDGCEETPQFSCTVLRQEKGGGWAPLRTEVGGSGWGCRVWIPQASGTYRIRANNDCGCTLRLQHDLVY